MDAEEIRVVIADDSAAMRSCVRYLLERVSGLSVVGMACDGREAVELVETLSPHVLILDIYMPVMDGFTTMATLRQRGCQVPILILSASDEPILVMESVENGVHGFVLKDEAPEFLPYAVQRAAQGKDSLHSPRIRMIYKSLLDTPNPRLS